MRRMILLLLGAALALLVACGGDSKDESTIDATPTPEASACGPDRAHAAGEFDQTITSGGIERQYILHVPPGYDASEAMPVVLLFHGFALNGRIMLDYTELGDLADREGFLVVSPTGTGDPHFWNTLEGTGDVDDVLFVNDLLDKLNGELCIDQERTFATGYSNGGGMSARLACEEPPRVHAVGLVASVYPDCAGNVPVIAFHGTADPLVAFEGRATPESGGFAFPPIRESVASLAAAVGCATEPEVTQPGPHVELSTYNGCDLGDGAVQLYVVDGGGHTWPGGAANIGDQAATTHEIDASELIWQFFAAFD